MTDNPESTTYNTEPVLRSEFLKFKDEILSLISQKETALYNKIDNYKEEMGSTETVIDGKTGKLYQYDDPRELAKALDWALDLSAEEVKKISKAAIKNVKDNFTKEIMCDKTIKVYQELVNNN